VPSWGASSKANPVLYINNGDPPPNTPIGYTWLQETDGTPLGILVAITKPSIFSLCTLTTAGVKRISYG
jgi:hypothetical protein